MRLVFVIDDFDGLEPGAWVEDLKTGHVGFLVRRGVDGLVVSGSDRAATAWAKTGRPLVVLGDGRLPRGATRVAAGDGAATTAVAALTDPA